MREVWKDITGYEGIYQVSNHGRVRSLPRKDNLGHSWNEYYLKLTPNKLGYIRVYLSKNGKAERALVHRLVAEAFVDRRDEGHNIVNHLDNNPSNNHADNLEWTTYKGNMEWAAKQGRMKANAQAYKNFDAIHKKRRKAVIAISPTGERTYFESLTEAGKKLGVNSFHIADVCKKEYGYNRLKGYDFEFADPEMQAAANAAKPKRIKMSKEERSIFISNLHKGNKYSLGKKCSEAAKQAIRELHSKPIIQMDKAGNIIASYSSVKEAYDKTGISHTYEVASGKRKTAGGYVWKWKEKG